MKTLPSTYTALQILEILGSNPGVYFASIFQEQLVLRSEYSNDDARYTHIFMCDFYVAIAKRFLPDTPQSLLSVLSKVFKYEVGLLMVNWRLGFIAENPEIDFTKGFTCIGDKREQSMKDAEFQIYKTMMYKKYNVLKASELKIGMI